MKLPTLYQLADEYLVASQQLQESELPAEVIRDTLEGLTGPLEQRATSIMQMARNQISLADQIDQAIAAMQARAGMLRKNADRIEEYLIEQMERAGIKEASCPYFKITVTENPAAVKIDEGAIVPEKYLSYPEVKIPEAKPDRKKIKAALEAGETIPGCELKRGKRLTVK